jgi:hypothetical protein
MSDTKTMVMEAHKSLQLSSKELERVARLSERIEDLKQRGQVIEDKIKELEDRKKNVLLSADIYETRYNLKMSEAKVLFCKEKQATAEQWDDYLSRINPLHF